ncbi:MAG: nucleotidyltransferase family protein [Actinomycetota bacterium]
MKALILAAGYATRLRPLTDTIPKQLLPVGGRPMVDWIVDKVRDAGIDEIHLVTNGRFAPLFDSWAETTHVTVHDDGTTTNETRLGAIGDVQFVRNQTGWDDDLLVIAGDNLFDYSLADFVRFAAGKNNASAVAVYDVGERELAKQYGVIDLDGGDRVVGFVEKPAEPPTTLCATATYLYAREDARLVDTYLDEGNPPDQPGHFISWLYQREPVYGFRIPGGWYDIGDAAQLLEADNRLRTLAGLPFRNSYSLD